MSQTDWAIVVASFFTSALSGVVGLGGGMLLMMIMASVYPARVVIPLHGMVQLASNVSRGWLGRRDVVWSIVGPIALGTVVGAAVGSQVVVQLPERMLSVVLASAVLVLTWAPPVPGAPRMPGKYFWVGAINSFLSLLIGATGPLLAPFIVRERLPKGPTIVTQAAGQACVHATKIVVFLMLGFQIGSYAPLLVAMIVASTLGSYASKFLLDRLPERAFRVAFQWTVTLLALRLLVGAL